MRMKMFAAETADAAKAMIFAEMGEDAVILSEREIDGGVEIRAATDKLGGGMVPAEPFAFSNLRNGPRGRLIDDPARMRARDALAWHGAPSRFAERVAKLGSEGGATPDAEEIIACGLSQAMSFAPLEAIPTQNIVLVGAPGHGRTATTAKITRRAAIEGGRIMPVAADMDGAGGGEQLGAYLARERSQIRIARTPESLFALLRELTALGDRWVVDLPAINPFDMDDVASLDDAISAIGAEPILVLSAEGHPEDQAEAAAAFARIGVKRAILSKMDIARRRGGAVAALASAKIALSHIAVSPYIGGGLAPADSDRLASLLMEDTPGRIALKGAA